MALCFEGGTLFYRLFIELAISIPPDICRNELQKSIKRQTKKAGGTLAFCYAIL
jgi:hypothetical protein